MYFQENLQGCWGIFRINAFYFFVFYLLGYILIILLIIFGDGIWFKYSVGCRSAGLMALWAVMRMTVAFSVLYYSLFTQIICHCVDGQEVFPKFGWLYSLSQAGSHSLRLPFSFSTPPALPFFAHHSSLLCTCLLISCPIKHRISKTIQCWTVNLHNCEPAKLPFSARNLTWLFICIKES